VESAKGVNEHERGRVFLFGECGTTEESTCAGPGTRYRYASHNIVRK